MQRIDAEIQAHPLEFATVSGRLHYPNRRPREVELYILAGDRAETTSAATHHPEVVQRLTARAKVWDATLPTEFEKTEKKQD